MSVKKVALAAVMGAAAAAVAQQQTGAARAGVVLTDMDTKAAPCNDFYDYANGAWRAKNPIPASMDRWSRRWQSGEVNKDQLRVILDEVSADASRPKGSPGQVAGDFYAACVNVKAVDAAGAAPVKPMLAQLAAIQDVAGVSRAIETLTASGLSVPFNFYGSPDQHDPTRTVADLGAGGLGLPDRDYYVKPEERFVKARAGYVAYVAKLLRLSGESEAAAQADAAVVMKFETALAKASLDNVALRDPKATDHVMSFEKMTKLAPAFDWAAFYRSAGVPAGSVNVEQPVFQAELQRQLTATPVAEWKTYLRWQLLNNSAQFLSEPFVEARFDFYNRQLAGVGELKPRATRCAEQADALLGEALGREYVQKYFPPEAKQRATEMVTNIVAAMHDTLEGLDWMTPATKQKALEKLATLKLKIGYPDKWTDYSSVQISRDAFYADAMAAVRFDVRDNWSTIGKPTDRSRWGFTPPTSNASYNPLLNEITFPAGILQPPAFSVKALDALNYGAIGVVIGHEISHGFDDQGAQYDAQGRLNDWWTPADLDKFHAKTACVVRQFDAFTIDGVPDVHINGKLVLGESIADLAGLKIAYRAYQKTPEYKEGEKVDGFTLDQQFFLAWGQFRGDETRPETQKLMVQGDPHPVAKYRVLGPMQNFAPFQKAFACPNGAAMTRPDAERCVIW